MYRWDSPRGRTAAHRRWARAVKARDGYQCQRCGYQGTPDAGDVEADHIDNWASGGPDDINNGTTLCTGCHAPKSREEARQGSKRRASRARLPLDAHPGLRP